MRGFRDFIMRGNLVQLAVAFVMGVAFAAVVNSFVNDLISPLLGLFGGANFSGEGSCIQGDCTAVVDPATGAVTYANGVFLAWGSFLTAIITFLITAAVIYFFVVKPYERIEQRWAKEQGPDGPTEVELLAEIRDALRSPS
jgi:large conductance mechanosensitive channel